MVRRVLLGVLLGAAAVPVPASAAVVSAPDQHRLVFTAARGESNAVWIRDAPGGAAVSDYATPLTAGDGCSSGEPVLCPRASAPTPYVTLDNRADVAYVDVAGSPHAYVEGGPGDDGLTVGSHCSVTVWGEQGDDVVFTNANCGGIAYGGAGDDRIRGNPREQGDVFHGGRGDDLLSPSGASQWSFAYGGSGDDRIVQEAAAAQNGVFMRILEGGAGDDLIVGGARTIDGGGGSDTLVAEAPWDRSSEVRGGAGDDVIDVFDEGSAEGERPPGDTVDCGSDTDLVYVDRDDVVTSACEQVLAGPAPELPGVRQARDDAAAIPKPDPRPPAAWGGPTPGT